MSAPIRSLLAVMLLACVAFASATVARVNEESGSWAILLLLCTLPLALASLRHARGNELLLTTAILLGLGGLHLFTKATANWQMTLRIEDRQGPIELRGDRNYTEPVREPHRVPFHAINDAWRILRSDATPCMVSWTNGSDHVDVQAPLKDFFRPRSISGIGGSPLTMLTLFFLSALLLGAWARLFFKHLPPRSGLLRSHAGLALVFLSGLLIAAVILSPGQWLSNEFLSRPDDWLCYETGARVMLTGNWALMPAPGGVEVWSLLYTPIIAGLHALMGPAIGPIYVVQFATPFLLVPLFVRLPENVNRPLRIGAALVISCFVLVDIDLHYAWHLLSDMLPLLLLLLLIIALKESWDMRMVALLCGLLYLARLELIGIGPLVFCLFLLNKERASGRERLGFIAIYLLCIAPYFVRWFLLYQNLRPFPVAMQDTGHVPLETILTAKHLGLKLRALFGDYGAINPALRFRFHWLPIHGAFLFALVFAWMERRFDRLSLFVLVLFGYVLCTRLLSPSVGIYGHRHSLMLVLLEMVFVALVARPFSAGPHRSITAPSPV